MFNSLRTAARAVVNSMNRPVALAVVFSLNLVLGGGESAEAAFNVAQTGGTLNVSGPIVNPNDYAFFIGAGSGQVHVVDSGVYEGLFSSVQHINVNVWGGNKVVVRLLAVEITGDLTIATGDGSDGILLVYNNIGGSVVKGAMGSVLIDTGGGDDLLDTQHNTFHGSFDVGTGEGADDVSLYDNLINGTAAFHTGAGSDELKVGYDHANPVYPANEIHGDLYADTAEGLDIVEVALNAIDGSAMLDTGPGWSDVTIRDNEILGDLSLMTGDGDDTVYVLGNEIESDVSLNLGASKLEKYLFVGDENQLRGSLSINVGDSLITAVVLVSNEVKRETTVMLGNTPASWIGADGNLFRGNVTLDTMGAVTMYLYFNSIDRNLTVNTSNAPDTVRLLKNTCEADVAIDVGGGNDTLELGDPVFFLGVYPNDFNANLTVDGGTGFDALFHDPFNNYAVPPSSQGFESVFP